MAKRTVKIKIPIGYPDEYVALIEYIWRRHNELGASSPLLNNPVIDMTEFEQLMNEALAKRTEALEHYAAAQALMMQSRKHMGVEKGQTIRTPNTLYYHIDGIKRFLVIQNRDEEQNLEQWGFNVVVGTAKMPVRKKKSTEGLPFK